MEAAIRAGVLVGGASRRMGRPKQLLEWNGRPLLATIIEVLRAVIPQIALIGAGPIPVELTALPRLADAPDARGPLAGVLAALRSEPAAAWLILACDQPFVSAEALRWLLMQRAADRAMILPCCIAGTVEPLLALYEPSALAILEEMSACGEQSLQPLAAHAAVSAPFVPVPLQRAWLSVNTPAEWVRARTGGAIQPG